MKIQNPHLRAFPAAKIPFMRHQVGFISIKEITSASIGPKGDEIISVAKVPVFNLVCYGETPWSAQLMAENA